jgi:hypothetical protein
MLHLTGVAWEPAIVTALILHGLLLSGALLLGMLALVVPSWRPLVQRGSRRTGLAPPV